MASPQTSNIVDKSNELDKLKEGVMSNKVGYTALLLAGLGLILIVVLFILFVVAPAPPTLKATITKEKANNTSPTPGVVPKMNVLYTITSTNSNDGDSFIFNKAKEYILYYVKNANPSGGNSMTINLESAGNFTLPAQNMTIAYTDENGVSHYSKFFVGS